MHFNMDRYTEVCIEHCGEKPPLQWIEIALMLRPRIDHGWHFEQDDDGKPFWAFGLGGAALLVIDVELETHRYHLFEHASDSDRFFDNIGGLAILLDELELANRGLTCLQSEMIEDGIGSTTMLAQLLQELARQDAKLDPN